MRLGYRDLASPPVAVGEQAWYELELVVEPAPIGLEGLEVTVTNEAVHEWLTVRTGGNPNHAFGYRIIQGARLEEASSRSEDNTALFRWLFIPVHHGREVCIVLPKGECGRLRADDRGVPPELTEDAIDLEDLTAVVVLPPDIWVFTRAWDWNRRR